MNDTTGNDIDRILGVLKKLEAILIAFFALFREIYLYPPPSLQYFHIFSHRPHVHVLKAIDRQEKYFKILVGKVVPGYFLYFDRDFLYDPFLFVDRDFLKLDFFPP